MSLLNLLNIGKSAIFASQAAINVTSHNIANVNTPGYTRQEAILRIATPIVPVAGGYLGMGVNVSSIERRYDRFISGQLLGQEQNYGKSSVMDQVLGQVEQVFNDAGGAGLSDSLNAFFDAWRTLSSTPEDTAKRTVLISDANTLVSTMKQMESGMLGTIKEMNGEIVDVAGRVNGSRRTSPDSTRRSCRSSPAAVARRRTTCGTRGTGSSPNCPASRRSAPWRTRTAP